MKQFLKKTILFLLTPLLVLFLIEFYLRNQEHAFKIKSNYLKDNIADIENLFLGSSHTQNAINPAFFSKQTSNLGYASQDIKIDSMLFFKFLPKMKNLKNVVIELDYHRLDEENGEDYFRLPWYYFYYGVDCVGFTDKISLYASNVPFFNNVLIDELKAKENKKIVNKFGFVVKNFQNDFLEMNYDSLKIDKSAIDRLKTRHKNISMRNRIKNVRRIFEMVSYCNENNINVYIISTPMYYTYRRLMIKEKDAYRKKIIDSLVTYQKVKFIDLEKSKNYNLHDYSNDDHLNSDGAKKMSLQLNAIFNSK